MKLAILSSYGGPSSIKIVDQPTPAPLPNQVRIRIKATSINDWDWSIAQGSPFYIRLFCGLLKPKFATPGVDFAGVVDKVGAEVRGFQIGDRVFGDLSEVGFGGFSESICVPPKAVVKLPDRFSYEQAAALPHAFCLAQQAIEHLGPLQKDDVILVNGAGGGVGAIAARLLKPLGVHLIGVDHTNKLHFMKAMGYDDIIDYTETDFTQQGLQLRGIIDPRTTRSPWRLAKSLKPGGVYATVGGRSWRLIQILLFGWLIKWLSRRTIQIVSLKPNQNLDLATHKLAPTQINGMIDGPYPFAQLRQAIERFGDATHMGKVVVSMEDANEAGPT